MNKASADMRNSCEMVDCYQARRVSPGVCGGPVLLIWLI
ncbi:hypothetical protein ALQ60_101084 [Pseudomonas syringae pv. papulans]|nr:hypothetical protein ALO65_101165 [Pseudomonas syringae pv. papulans]RMN40000.1 hypothetical protein ALQ60_101084 [Pseudomonas syringae pv. papulans]RMN80554.1 hypothetical protein ALQ56_101540 [Pseudomonas syringae pv. papulans]RMV46410.1 hypothetical protein ALP11_101321 [Pseudomonas syringae pv. papulans]